MLFKNKLLFLTIIFLFTGSSFGQTDPVEDKDQLKKLNHDNEQESYWVDSFHQSVANSVFHSASWFDSFFLEEGDVQQSPKTSARIRFGWEPKSRDYGDIGVRFRVKLRLPHLKDKVDVILSDDADDEINQLPLDAVNTKSTLDEENFAAALRFTHKNKGQYFTDSRIGISGGDIFVRARHRRNYLSGNRHKFRLEPSVYYFLNDGVGAKVLLEYDYQLDATSQNRINYSTNISESFSGLKWKLGFYHLQQISETQAAVYGFQIAGEKNGDRGSFVDTYSLNYRYRFGVLRKWLFFEIEPFVEFPEQYSYKVTPGLALRVEGFFYQDNK
jgi:hypothetical protein